MHIYDGAIFIFLLGSPQTLGVFGSPLAAVLNSVQIMVMGHVWTKIADTLNEYAPVPVIFNLAHCLCPPQILLIYFCFFL